MFSLQGSDISHFLFAMGCLLAAAHLFGFMAERMYIPRVIGEVFAGISIRADTVRTLFSKCFSLDVFRVSSGGKTLWSPLSVWSAYANVLLRAEISNQLYQGGC